MNLLELKNVTKQFGGLTAVGNVDLQVKKGTIHGLIGPNGAGKTTIFNLITQIYPLTEGEILFDGEPIHELPTHLISKIGITRTFQNIRLFKDLTTYENILTACHFNSQYSYFDAIARTKKFRVGEEVLKNNCELLLDLLKLTDQRDVLAKNLPYGYQRRLEIARAVALIPKLLLLDEPAAGMNPDEEIQLMEIIRHISKQFDLTVLIIEHHMDLVMNLCDTIMVINFGRVLAEGTPEEIQRDSRVVDAYLGEGGEE